MSGESLFSLLIKKSAESDEAAVLENLVKAFSRVHLECTIQSGKFDEHISDYKCVFAKQALPKDILSLYDLEKRFSEPYFMGKVLHLSSHIRHTNFNDHITVQDSPKRDILWWLEDLRAETLFLKDRPLDTHNFRVFSNKALEKYNALDSLSSLEISLVYLTVVGRQRNGVFHHDEIEDLQTQLESILPRNIQDKLRSLIEEYLSIPDDSDGVTASLVAEKWITLTDGKLSDIFHKECMDGNSLRTFANGENLLQDDDKSDQVDENDFSETSNDTDDMPQESLDEDGEPSEDASDDTASSENVNSDESIDQDLTDSDKSPDVAPDTNDDHTEENDLSNAIQDLVSTFDDEIKASQPVQFDESSYKESLKEKEEIRKVLAAANKAFPKDQSSFTTRPPTSSDFQLASKLVTIFRKAKWRAPTKTILKSNSPPGRLNSRDAVAMAAQKSMGLRPQHIEPFRRTVYKTEDSPPIFLGMACDVSGSMSDSTEPMSKLMWACARAIPRVGGTFAAVSFGRTVKGLVKPGKKINQVPVFTARANYEASYEAITALTGALNYMSKKPGVKILIISSDSEWRPEQLEPTVEFLTKLEKVYGVHIFWVPFQGEIDYSQYYSPFTKGTLPLLRVGSLVSFNKLSDAPIELGKIIAKEIGSH